MQRTMVRAVVFFPGEILGEMGGGELIGCSKHGVWHCDCGLVLYDYIWFWYTGDRFRVLQGKSACCLSLICVRGLEHLPRTE